jgi:hypothetical protein
VEIQSEIVRQENQIAGRGVMKKSPLKFYVSHLAVRIITTIHIAHLLLSYYPPYFQKTLRSFSQGVDIYWMLASSLLIPLYVGFESWWMFRAEPPQKRALVIDWLLAGLWFAIWWVVVVRSLYRYYPIWP